MADTSKDTIYIDIDDEITGIIDKVHASDGKIVALVLPKRAAVLQSIVNMKLLKRAADDEKKHLVLITSEAGLLPLAGVAGLHVAKSLTSRPEIPTAPDADDAEETIDEPAGDIEPDFTPAAVALTPVGQLAGLPPMDDDEVETVELDDETAAEDDQSSKTFEPPVTAKNPKNKKLAVPNFERFRLVMVAGGIGLIILIVGLYFALSVLPRAEISIATNARNINLSFAFTADSQAKTVDKTNHVLPAKIVDQPKTSTEQAAATGSKNLGSKASGKVTLSLADCSTAQVTIPAGSGITSNGLTYIMQQEADMTSVKVGNNCKNSEFPQYSSSTVDVIAQQGGANYNRDAGSTFSVPKYPGVSASNSAAVSGGTDNVVKVVSQNDVDAAKAKMTTNNSASVRTTLQTKLKNSGYYPLLVTFTTGDPVVTTSVNVGDQADTFTVNQVVTYTLMGVKQDDMKTLLTDSIKEKVDSKKQSILDDGLNTARFNLEGGTPTAAQLTVQATGVAGPELNVDTITKQILGKKTGEIQALLKSNPDVTDVKVKYSPFWVGSVPTNASKVKVIIEKPKVTANPNANATNP